MEKTKTVVHVFLELEKERVGLLLNFNYLSKFNLFKSLSRIPVMRLLTCPRETHYIKTTESYARAASEIKRKAIENAYPDLVDDTRLE
jgi:hypothetical protein